MPEYVMLSSLGPDGYARLTENPERLREVVPTDSGAVTIRRS